MVLMPSNTQERKGPGVLLMQHGKLLWLMGRYCLLRGAVLLLFHLDILVTLEVPQQVLQASNNRHKRALAEH